MNIQSWMIKSWTTRECYLPPDLDGLPRFRHASTQVRHEDGASDSSSTGLRSGDTVWIAQDDQWLAGLAWEWVEARPGLVMLADPNSIITNLRVVDKNRQPVSGLHKIVAVNQLVHGLDWQRMVRSRLTDRVPSPGPSLGPVPAMDSNRVTRLIKPLRESRLRTTDKKQAPSAAALHTGLGQELRHAA